jgi:nitroreductase
MDVFDAIAKRHSYRGPFKKQQVPRDDLRTIVQAGIQAPSGCNAQTTTFVIIDHPDTLKTVSGMIDAKTVPPAMIVCVAEPRAVFKDMSFEKEDCAAAVENMLLAITALGYATVWTDGVLRVDDRAAKIGGLLGVPDDRQVQVLLPVGVPEEPCEPREKLPFAQRACFNRYNI